MKMEKTIARVLSKEDKEFYKEVFAKTAEKYGKNTLAFKTITNGISVDNVTGSQFFWNANLGFYLPKNKRVISLEDAEAINNQDKSFFKRFYTNTPEIILRTEIQTRKKEKYILKDLTSQVKGEGFEFSSENPLRISGLELVKDKNPRNQSGLLLKIGNDTKIINDKRFAHSNDKKQIQFGEKTKLIYTKENGLSKVGLDIEPYLHSYDGYLACSNDYGQVVIVDVKKDVVL